MADSNVVFAGPLTLPGSTAYAPPIEGQGTRMMWYPQKAAFRVGYVDGTQWDKANIGNYSFGAGYNSIASGDNSLAFGTSTTASNYSTIAMGSYATASGLYSTAFGTNTTASGWYSTALGRNTTAAGDRTIAMGSEATANSSYCVAIGQSVTANSFSSTALGSWNNPIISSATYSWNPSEPLLIVGNGTGPSAKSNALVILKNGNMGIGNSAPTSPLSFPSVVGKKISFYESGPGEYGIGLHPGELRLYADQIGSKVSFGTQDNAGNFAENAKAERNGAFAFSIFGSLWVNGTTYTSDERFKLNITPIQSPLQKLMQLNGVEYEMKTDAFPQNHFLPGRQIGLLAQNVEKIIPEAVNEKDGYKGVDYARLVPLLIESIKELKKEVEELKSKIR